MSDELDCPGADTIYPLGVVMPDGSVPVVRHTRDHGYQMGALRRPPEGKPIYGELMQLEESDGPWHRVRPVLGASESRKGPAKVNSQEYLKGWTNIFGHQTRGEA